MEEFVVGPFSNIESLLVHDKVGLLQPILLNGSDIDLERFLQAPFISLVSIDHRLKLLIIDEGLEKVGIRLVVPAKRTQLDRHVNMDLFKLNRLVEGDLLIAAGR